MLTEPVIAAATRSSTSATKWSRLRSSCCVSPVPLTHPRNHLEYVPYCHYVAGLVGKGFSQLFSATGKGARSLAQQLELSNLVCFFRRPTSSVTSVRTPTGAASSGCARSGAPPSTPPMAAPHPQTSSSCSVTHTALHGPRALRRMCDTLDYLHPCLLRTQSTLNFVAIPVTMALATLDLCLMDPEMFKWNIKICKAKVAKVRSPPFPITPTISPQPFTWIAALD